MPTDRQRNKTAQLEQEIAFLERLSTRLPHHIAIWETLGCLYTETGRYEEGLNADRQVVRMHPASPVAWYNLACSLALLHGGASDTFSALEKAIALGYDDWTWMEQDSDLDVLHGDPRYQRLLARLRAACLPDD